MIVECCDPRVKVSRSTKDAWITRDEGNTACLPLVKIGSGGEGEIGLSVPQMEGAEDAGSIGVAIAHSIKTVCRSPVQGTFVEKRRRFMLESLYRANRIKCEINMIR